MDKFKGIFSALVTPLDKNDNVNTKSLEQLVKFNIKQGVKGFYVGGSTGESFLMDVNERIKVLETVKETAKNSTLLAHVGCLNEKDAVLLGKKAYELGYDAVSSVAPVYFKYSFEDIKNYYNRLADEAGLPMLVYHIPALSGVNMGVKEISQFLSDDKFLGIKYTSNDFFTMERCKTAFPNKIIYNGYDEMFVSGLAMGADGAIGTTYNFMGDKFVKIHKLFLDGKIDKAREIQAEANDIIEILIKAGVMPATKEILNQLGINVGVCRRPFSEVSEENKKLIAEKVIPLLGV